MSCDDFPSLHERLILVIHEKLKMVPEFVYIGLFIIYDGDKLPNLIGNDEQRKPKLLNWSIIPKFGAKKKFTCLFIYIIWK